MDVLLAASRSDNVNLRVDALAGGGLTAKIIDVEAFALENTMQLISTQAGPIANAHIVAVMDVGATTQTSTVTTADARLPSETT